jgi:hexulose-6-phosphate isomerase
MRIGIIDGALTKDYDMVRWDRTHQLAHELGFDGLELGVAARYDQSQLWDPAGRRRLGRLAEEAGITTPSICLHAYWHYSFASPDAAVRERARRIADEAATAAAELDAKRILIPLTCPPGVPTADARARWVEGIGACSRAAEAARVAFCLENVGCAFADEPEQIIDLVDAINSPAVMVYYDPGNAVKRRQDPLEGIRLYAQRLGQLHVKEMGGTYLGEGQVPWPQIIAELTRIGYDGWLVLETNPTEDPHSAAWRNLETLGAWLQCQSQS